MQYPSHLKPEDQFVRTIYTGVTLMAEPIGVFSTWCITGVAAIVGLIVANIDAVSKIIAVASLRWGIILLTASMLAGAVAKLIGIAIQHGIAMLESLYAELATPEGAGTLERMTASSEEIQARMVEPFLWPIKNIMLRAARRGVVDPIAGEKRFVKMLCIQMYASYMQIGLATTGLLFFAFGIYL